MSRCRSNYLGDSTYEAWYSQGLLRKLTLFLSRLPGLLRRRVWYIFHDGFNIPASRPPCPVPQGHNHGSVTYTLVLINTSSEIRHILYIERTFCYWPQGAHTQTDRRSPLEALYHFAYLNDFGVRPTLKILIPEDGPAICNR